MFNEWVEITGDLPFEVSRVIDERLVDVGRADAMCFELVTGVGTFLSGFWKASSVPSVCVSSKVVSPRQESSEERSKRCN